MSILFSACNFFYSYPPGEGKRNAMDEQKKEGAIERAKGVFGDDWKTLTDEKRAAGIAFFKRNPDASDDEARRFVESGEYDVYDQCESLEELSRRYVKRLKIDDKVRWIARKAPSEYIKHDELGAGFKLENAVEAVMFGREGAEPFNGYVVLEKRLLTPRS